MLRPQPSHPTHPLRALLAAGTTGYTPLIYAAREGHADVCELLLSLGADPNAATRSGGATALQRAAYTGHLAVVRLLLAAGAAPAQQDADGQTALHKAVQQVSAWMGGWGAEATWLAGSSWDEEVQQTC